MPEIPFAVLWEIPKNRLMPLKDSLKGYLESTSVSNIHGFQYSFCIFPNGDNDARRGKTYIFLKLDLGKLKKVKAECTFTVKSANCLRPYGCTYEQSVGRGAEICSTNDFFDPQKKFIVDEKLIVKCDGTFEVETGVPRQQKWDGVALGDRLWWKNDSKDITIVADGKEIKAHKIILPSHFCSKKQEIIENKSNKESNEIKIPNFSFKIVETAVRLIYECNFYTCLTLEELMSLFRFFDQYCIHDLKEKVESVLINKISAANVCRLTNFSISATSDKLEERCTEFLMIAFASKTPLSNANELDNDVIMTVLQNSLYSVV
uniref:BTB domain-containing protein n=1 Tax=Panagrolaimus davidi TaxID=227884 RepID=A0A914QPL4_9BILA